MTNVVIRYGCSHGSFLDAPFGKDGCEECVQQSKRRFEAAKSRRYKFKSSSSSCYSLTDGGGVDDSSQFKNITDNYYYNVVANEDDWTEDGKSRIKVGMKIDVEYWDEHNNRYADKNCKLHDEGNISHILANCFAEYINEKDEIDFSISYDEENLNHLQNAKIHEVLLKRISCYANEIWSLVFHFKSVEELVNFIRKDVLKKKAENNTPSETNSSLIRLPSLEQNDHEINNYGMMGFGVASNTELPGDFGRLTHEDMLLCYMMYGQEGVDMMKMNEHHNKEDEYDY